MMKPVVRLKPLIRVIWVHNVGNLKGVGRIYQQTFVDTYSKVAHCKLYVTKAPITAADLLNDRGLSPSSWCKLRYR